MLSRSSPTVPTMITVAESERRAREAYQRGREDAHLMRNNHPWLGVVTIVVALAGAAALSVAATNGSFTQDQRAVGASAGVVSQPVATGSSR